MLNYILKRLFLIIPMLIGISLVSFIVMHLAPGDPTSLRYGLNPEVSLSARAHLKELYGLDKPILIQFLTWLKRISTFDLGNSFIDGRPVLSKIKERLPQTILLEALSLLLILSLAIPIGVSSAIKQGGAYDRVMSVVVFIGFSMPTFWIALIAIFIFGFTLGWLPISGFRPWYAEYLSGWASIKDMALHLILPVATTAFGGLAGISRYMRSSMLEVIRQEYILAARAKGLKERRIIYRHALKNALLPIVTILGLSLPGLISGGVIFETIFSWPGMGRLGYEAIMNYDYPVVMGVGLMSAFLTLFGIFLSDITYALVDPRIRYE